jgi:hypothetical protein
METGYSRDPNTVSSDHPFSLLKKGKHVQFSWMLTIWVAPSARIQAGLPVGVMALLAENAYFRKH